MLALEEIGPGTHFRRLIDGTLFYVQAVDGERIKILNGMTRKMSWISYGNLYERYEVTE